MRRRGQHRACTLSISQKERPLAAAAFAGLPAGTAPHGLYVPATCARLERAPLGVAGLVRAMYSIHSQCAAFFGVITSQASTDKGFPDRNEILLRDYALVSPRVGAGLLTLKTGVVTYPSALVTGGQTTT